jgi:hypothetical protein
LRARATGPAERMTGMAQVLARRGVAVTALVGPPP